jgi:pimeloyl-ACP methyl ester carboxylesterase
MTTFVLLPGAGGAAWYWHRVVPLLEAAGQTVIAVDLPADDENAGLAAYADLVVRAMGDHDDVVLVAQSLGGFTAAAVAARPNVRLGGLVFLNAMIPEPGETAGAWWDNTGSEKARVAAAKEHGYSEKLELYTYFLHDVPQDVVDSGASHQHDEAKTIFGDACRFERWPDIPIRVLAGREDRFFPIAFQSRVAKERLGKDVEPVPGGHLAALSYPEAFVEQLLAR